MAELAVPAGASAARTGEDPGDSLVLQIHAAPPQRLPLHGSCYRIGREPGSDLRVDHAVVSRRHALLERHGNDWLLRDQASTNGLWWQGRRVRELLLRNGDRVRLGPPDQADVPEIRFVRNPPPRLPPLLRGLALTWAALLGGGTLLVLFSSLTMPIRGSLAKVKGPLVVYDRQGTPIASVHDRRHRELERLGEYPEVLVHALLASEDSRFWWHPGVDPIGTLRAVAINLLGGRVLEGGSTITQQLARSLYPEWVGQGETLGRKWRELLVALQLEARFSKSELLLSYLNRVYLGAGWGFEDASRRLFGKPAAKLELEEAALLVGLLPSPNGNDPCVDPRAALGARNRVLERMASSWRLGADRARQARRLPVRLASDACRGDARLNAPFYVDQVRRDLGALVGEDVAGEGNYLIDTHLDPTLQKLVERLLRERLERARSAQVGQGAVVVLDSRSGGILAIAGGRDYQQSQFNRASMALRQPGSTFKLVPYLVALERGSRPEEGVSCAPLRWRGQRFESGCAGTISLRRALAISSNTAALRIARKVGLEAVVSKARDLGFSSPLSAVPGLALGQSEVTLLELTAAYAAVANDGVWHAPSTIRRLTDAEGCSSGDETEAEKGCRARAGRSTASAGRRVMKTATARSMQSMLRGVVQGGTGTAASLGGKEWGKTGTTNEARDLLFVGSDPKHQRVIGVWLGNDDNRPTRATSAMAAALWAEIVRASEGSSG